jgi:hypothetical protein
VPDDKSELLLVISPLIGTIGLLPSKTSWPHVYTLLVLWYLRCEEGHLRLLFASHDDPKLYLPALIYKTCSNSSGSEKDH